MNEEIQSTNEELHAMNARLAARIDDLRRANEGMSTLLQSAQIATIVLDRNMIIRSFTPAVAAIFDLIPSDRGRPITDIANSLDEVDLARDVRQVLDERELLERLVHIRGGAVFHLMRVLPYRSSDNELDGVVLTFVDVTAVVVAEEQQRVLVSELNHRVRNMLQVVMGLANQSIHRSDNLQQFGETFFGRIQALARAYELLSRDGWHKVPLAELLHTQMSPFANEPDRYCLDGENLTLKPNAALSLGLVLYELSTNATKYGALSTATGRIGVSWALEKPLDGQPNLVLRWRERGGPIVRPPTRHGFGSELVERQLRYELSGVAAMDYMEDGLVVTLTIPASEAVEMRS